ncbi:hypothetical protein KFU41_15065 [Escherichia coli]|jgi:hypothetical protein|uniref:hypothetical protein n=1 Tax=Enterobacteriaceae TaxID=543 RepID=UPI0020922E58|nr:MULTISPECIES: hypothetical protein [Enterobacteriaceae]MCO6575872.1 hypothetical protein [Escherichia coli]MCO6581027.1 hypothetical protein [Escherichia coli]MCO6586528.1 hypothetical protein [Escherichia coli]MDN9022647.1 hypothetical protein [Escherichia coli]WBA60313.1 hypothetical protein O6D90_17150 [Citrobacter sp. 21OH12SH02A-Citro]
MVKETIFLCALYLTAGFAIGFAVFSPGKESVNELKAKVAVAVYEGRAVCEKALDQWVCSIPKD